jgi:hypothetical protein
MGRDDINEARTLEMSSSAKVEIADSFVPGRSLEPSRSAFDQHQLHGRVRSEELVQSRGIRHLEPRRPGAEPVLVPEDQHQGVIVIDGLNLEPQPTREFGRSLYEAA